jgi:putative serine protease PepD
MDDTNRTSSDQPEPQAAGPATGTGWSTPTPGATPPRAPWSESGHDTGSIPRPSDTRQIPGVPTSEDSRGTPSDPAGATDSATTADWGTSTEPQPGLPATQPGAVPPGAVPPSGAIPPYGTIASDGDAPAPARKGRRSTAAIAALALGAGLLGGAAGAGIYAAVDDDTIAPVTSLDTEPADATGAADTADAADLSSVEDVAANLTPSVVSISIQGERGVGSGSGIVISSDGQILTNAHVADAAGDNGSLFVTFSDGTTTEAEVIGSDEQGDVAVIQAQDVSGLQPVEFGDSDALGVGEEVIAFGSPLGLDGTVTRGIVSALHRPVQAGDGLRTEDPTLFEAIQTDASINPGNSGGPLVNMAGQVVGINTAIASSPGNLTSGGSIGLGFAIPINTARFIAEQLVAGDEVAYARIGISVGGGNADVPGGTVAEVVDGSAADEAGLAEGDVVTHIDGRFLSDANALVAAARSYEPGDTVSLTYLRDGEELTVEVTLGSSAETS